MANIKNLKPFKAGDDPRRNTKGRPKGTLDFRKTYREKVQEKILVNGKRMTIEKALMIKLISMALKGKFQAYKLLMNYLYGKPVSFCPRCRNSDERAEKLAERKINIRTDFENFKKYFEENKNTKKD
jgi:hypothetical protein